jgi:membrane protein implicated in regulation of membrane protease activity
MLKNILALITGTVVLILGFVFSLVLFAVLISLGLLAWGFWWWKTRALRKAMQEQHGQRGTATAGVVIEGEAVVVEEAQTRIGVEPMRETLPPR